MDRRARHNGVCEIVVLEVHEHAFDMVDFEGATHALSNLAGSHHEMLDKELAAAVEQVGERHFALWPFEDVLLLDPDPRELAPLPTDLVALSRVGLFPLQECHTLLEPLLPRYDSVACYRCLDCLHYFVSFYSSLNRSLQWIIVWRSPK
jgi:hypothetical protein